MNFGTPVPLLLGIILIIGAVALFFLDKLKPGYERDYDKVYAVLCLLSGMFLLGHLTMELIPSFQQIIMVGMLIALMIQNIRSRTPSDGRFAQQSGVGMPPPGRDNYRPSRPPSRSSYRPDDRTSVRAELERTDLPPNDMAYRRNRPMLGGRSAPPSTGADFSGSDYSGSGYYDDAARDPGGYYDPSPYRDGGDSDESEGGFDQHSSSSRYSSSRKPDERIRSRRPLKLRGESGRYRRLKPGDPSGRRDF